MDYVNLPTKLKLLSIIVISIVLFGGVACAMLNIEIDIKVSKYILNAMYFTLFFLLMTVYFIATELDLNAEVLSNYGYPLTIRNIAERNTRKIIKCLVLYSITLIALLIIYLLIAISEMTATIIVLSLAVGTIIFMEYVLGINQSLLCKIREFEWKTKRWKKRDY